MIDFDVSVTYENEQGHVSGLRRLQLQARSLDELMSMLRVRAEQDGHRFRKIFIYHDIKLSDTLFVAPTRGQPHDSTRLA